MSELASFDIKMIRSEFLPARTIVLSPDMYDLLAEGGKATESKHQELLGKVLELNDLIRREGA